MAWILIVAPTLFVSLIATLMLAEWIVTRRRSRSGLQWCDNSPRQPRRIERSTNHEFR